ncbi:MAG: MarR family transcriptional regulator [Desulfobacteraceae bacterium]|nr:MarR family transcriptional regulator [Desulfobacteraceae bacterium]
MSSIPKNIPDCTIFLLAKAYQSAHGLFKAQLQPYGLTNMQHLVLEGLWYQEGITAAELSKLLILDKATLSGILDRMEDSGWISRVRDDVDKRLIRLYPAQKANQLKNDLIQLRIDTNEKLLSDFTPEEKIIFKRLLRVLI